MPKISKSRKSSTRSRKSATRSRKSSTRSRKSATRSRKSATRSRKSATRSRKSAKTKKGNGYRLGYRISGSTRIYVTSFRILLPLIQTMSNIVDKINETGGQIITNEEDLIKWSAQVEGANNDYTYEININRDDGFANVYMQLVDRSDAHPMIDALEPVIDGLIDNGTFWYDPGPMHATWDSNFYELFHTADEY